MAAAKHSPNPRLRAFKTRIPPFGGPRDACAYPSAGESVVGSMGGAQTQSPSNPLRTPNKPFNAGYAATSRRMVQLPLAEAGAILAMNRN
jgi:hypothetical protein